jgi:hypothetical protein
MKKLLLILLCPILLLTSCSKSGVIPEVEANIEETIVGKSWKLLNTDAGWFHLNDNNTYLTKDYLCDSLEQFGTWELDGSVLIMTHIIGSLEYVERNTIIVYNDSIVKVQSDTSATLDINIIFEVTEEVIRGCMNTTFLNFNPNAECPDTCMNAPVYGCMDDGACNYNSLANIDDGNCEYISCSGCMDDYALNYNSTATIDDGSCCYVSGCTDATALNYDPNACIDDGSCTYPLAIGDTHQGGIIFYLDGNGGGLIAAPTDQSTEIAWGCYMTLISGADGTAIGTGAQNTIHILNGCTTPNIAAYICDTLALGGYNDWFLPSIDELNEMYLNLHQQGLGGFAYSLYWSSTENDSYNAWVQNFSSGYQNYVSKDNFNGVRAVRAF